MQLRFDSFFLDNVGIRKCISIFVSMMACIRCVFQDLRTIGLSKKSSENKPLLFHVMYFLWYVSIDSYDCVVLVLLEIHPQVFFLGQHLVLVHL